MTDREKVISDLGKRYDPERDNLHLVFIPNGLVRDALALLREYDTALKLMVFQYCNYEEGFYHKFISAGEAAFRVLGIENGQSTDGVWEKWFQTNERGEDNA